MDSPFKLRARRELGYRKGANQCLTPRRCQSVHCRVLACLRLAWPRYLRAVSPVVTMPTLVARFQGYVPG